MDVHQHAAAVRCLHVAMFLCLMNLPIERAGTYKILCCVPKCLLDEQVHIIKADKSALLCFAVRSNMLHSYRTLSSVRGC